MSTIRTDGNRIQISGRFGMFDFHRALATIHNLAVKRGYPDIVLDFEQCTFTFAGPMLAVIADVATRRYDGLEATLFLPSRSVLRNRFINANWAYLADPGSHPESKFRGLSFVPAISFKSAADQQSSVHRMIDAVLSFVPGLEREDLAAIEWALGEITDNVLTHAEAKAGGFVQLTTNRKSRQVEFVVADGGVSIPKTLRAGHAEITSDPDALDRAIREGVTRDPAIGQGNGLFGTFQVVRVGDGYLHVHSRHGRLDWRKSELHVGNEQIPVNGTLVVAAMDCSNPKLLAQALEFDGQRHRPVDYMERFESADGSHLLVRIKDQASSFSSRVAGRPLRTKLQNLMTMHPGSRIVVDFEHVPIVSSSFADEVLGKLFLEMGPVRFSQQIELRNMAGIIRSLVDRAISQRMLGAHSDGAD